MRLKFFTAFHLYLGLIQLEIIRTVGCRGWLVIYKIDSSLTKSSCHENIGYRHCYENTLYKWWKQIFFQNHLKAKRVRSNFNLDRSWYFSFFGTCAIFLWQLRKAIDLQADFGSLPPFFFLTYNFHHLNFLWKPTGK